MAVINGTDAGESLTGTANADTINGFGGNDTIDGGAGDDVINGGAGNDIIQGGAGADTIDGGTGVDTLIGGADGDTYLVDDAGDQVIEAAGDTGTDTVLTTVSYTLSGGQAIEILQASGSAAINLTGNNFAQTVIGNNANNVIDGGLNTTGADTLQGRLGDDTYLVRNAGDVVLESAGQGTDTVFVAQSAGNYALPTGTNAQEIEVLSVADQSSSYAVNLSGNEFAQTIIGNQGANVLVDGGPVNGGAAFADVLIGLGGNDTYTVNVAGTQVIEAAGGGTDTVNTLVSFNSGNQSIETISASGAAQNTAANNGGVDGVYLTGGSANQAITGSAFADVLNGGGGNDTLTGGAGNDIYVVDGGDTIVEASSGATNSALDAVITSAPITLGAGLGIEQLFANGSVRFNANGSRSSTFTSAFTPAAYGFDTADGTRNLNSENTSTASVPFLNGNEVAQLIVGNASDNILDGNRNANLTTGSNTGAAFADTLAGLAGNDIYRVYGQEDVVLEDRNGGRDTIFTSASYSLATNDTNANTILGGTADDPATTTVNEFVQNTFYTVAEIEVLSTAVNSGTDAINLTGNAYGNIIVGNFGENVIAGGGTSAGGGTDVLIGLAGNDTYIIDSINTVVFEDAFNGLPDGTSVAGGDLDTVTVTAAASGFTLNAGTHVEVMNTNSGSGIAMVGNELAQSISGGAGNDTLAGGGGNDTLAGGLGDDTYRITDTNAVIQEAANGGNDSVFTAGISYRLAQGVSVEYLSTTAQGSTENISFTGNQLAQQIVGNYGDNVLDSGQGAVTGQGTLYNQTGDLSVGDTLIGLFGNDTYRVYSQNDVVLEQAGQGTDTVLSSASYTLGAGQSIEVLSASNQSATTNGLVLTGNELSNTIIGNDGQNTLNGGLGADTLIGRGGSDQFLFNTALGSGNVDTIQDFTAGDLIGVSRSIFTALGSGNVTADNFVVGTAATTTSQFFIYNQTTGQLFYDADGSGSASSAVLFAQLTAGTALGFNDLIAVA